VYSLVSERKNLLKSQISFSFSFSTLTHVL
jgi:hypothetical protein